MYVCKQQTYDQSKTICNLSFIPIICTRQHMTTPLQVSILDLGLNPREHFIQDLVQPRGGFEPKHLLGLGAIRRSVLHIILVGSIRDVAIEAFEEWGLRISQRKTN